MTTSRSGSFWQKTSPFRCSYRSLGLLLLVAHTLTGCGQPAKPRIAGESPRIGEQDNTPSATQQQGDALGQDPSTVPEEQPLTEETPPETPEGTSETTVVELGESADTNPEGSGALCAEVGAVVSTRVRYEQAFSSDSCVSETQELRCVDNKTAQWSGTFTHADCVLAEVEVPTEIAPVVTRTIERRVAYLTATVPYGEVCVSEPQEREILDGVPQAWNGTHTFESCSVELPGDCATLKHGQYQLRTRYLSESSPAESTCVAEVQRQTCENGQLSPWSGTFTFESCTTLGKASCEGGVPHNGIDTQIRYQAASVSFGGTCTSEEQTRTCDDGTFSPWSGSFAAEACVVEAAVGCGGLEHEQGEVRERFEAATVPFGESCRVETQRRSCNNGTLSPWSGSYTENFCLVSPPASCGETGHLQTQLRTRYQTTSVPFGETCTQEVQERTCNNGTFSDWTGTFPHAACEVENALSCGETPHAGMETRLAYETATVAFGETCNSEEQTRTCNNGTLSNWSGTHTEVTCSVAAPADCGSLLHDQSETRTHYEAAEVPFGSSCSSELQTRSCNNGVLSDWSGTFTETQCVVAAAADCGSLAHNQSESRTHFATAEVPFGETCQGEIQTRSCSNGVLSDWSGTFIETQCVVTAPADCGSLAHNQSETRTHYATEEVPFDETCQEEVQTRTCQNGTLSDWSGSFTFASCTVLPAGP